MMDRRKVSAPAGAVDLVPGAPQIEA